MSFPRYPKYKPSGVEWLGDVPEHWETTRLKNLFSLMKRLPEDDDEIVTAFRDGEVTLRLNRRIDGFTNAIQEHGYQRILQGDLVIHAMDAFAGAIGVSDSTGKSTPVYSVCAPKRNDINTYYYGRQLRHMALSGYINSLAKGIRERSTEFRWAESSNVVVAVPPFTEQSAIALFLDRETSKIDSLVGEQRRLIELLKEKRQAVISHAVTKGLNPNAPLKPSGIQWLGDVPEHWQITPVKFFADVGNGSTPSREVPEYWTESGFPWLNSSVVNQQTVSEAEGFVTDLALRECHLPIIKPPAVLVGITGQGRTRGMSAMLGIVATINQHVAYVKPNDAMLDVNFAFRVFESAYDKLRRDSEEAGATKGAITCEQIRNLRIPVPAIHEQYGIVAFLDAETSKLDALTAEAERAIELLQERRTALISAAVTGKIDVRSEGNLDNL